MKIIQKNQVIALLLMLSPLYEGAAAASSKKLRQRSSSRSVLEEEEEDFEPKAMFAKDRFHLPSRDSPVGAETKIIGGEDAPVDEYPWYSRGVDAFGEWWGCGGTLITPEFVLTAAHCGYDTTSGFQIGALCDPYGPGVGLNCGQKVETIDSTAVYNHPGWDPDAIVNDFTLVKLRKRANTEPVPIDQGDVSTSYTGGEPLWVIGLGADVHLPFGIKFYPDHVQHAEIPYVDSDTCSDIVGSYVSGLEITDVEMCAGPTELSEPDVGTCNGDSGGPIYDKERNTLVGVTSWGIQGLLGPYCGETPGVYARIADQWDEWIKPTICDNHSSPKPDFCEPEPPCEGDIFKFEMLTDRYGGDISWGIRKTNDDGEFEEIVYGPRGAAADEDYGNSASYNEEVCLPSDECYEFVIYDSYGDGLCCEWGEGGYRISLNGEVLKQSRFQGEKTDKVEFGDC